MRRVCIVVFALVLLGCAALVWWVNDSVQSERIERTLMARLTEATGFSVSFSGPVEFKWFPMPGLVMQGIEVSNPREAKAQPLARIEKVRVRLDLFGSLRYRLVKLGRLSVTGAHIFLARNAQGQANWETGAPTESTGGDVGGEDESDQLVSRIEAFEVDDLSVHYEDAETGSGFDLSAVLLNAERAAHGKPISLSLKGQFNQDPFVLTGTVARADQKQPPPNKTLPEPGDFRLDIKVELGNGDGTLTVSGVSSLSSDFSSANLDISLESRKPAALVTQLGEPEMAKWAKALGSVDFYGNFVGDGPDGLSLRKGQLNLGTKETFHLSVAGSMEDVIEGSGFAMDLNLQSTSPSQALSPLNLDLPPLDEVRGQAQLRGTLAAPRWEAVQVQIGLASGLELEAHGQVDGMGKGLTATFDLSGRAQSFGHLAESLSHWSPAAGANVESWVADMKERPVTAHLIELAPVVASAKVTGSGDAWRLVEAKGQAGESSGEWLRVSGQAGTLWPELAGLEVGADMYLPDLPKAWGPLKASARAKGSADGWVMDQFDLDLQRGRVTGTGSWTQKGEEKPRFALSLHSAQLDLRGPFSEPAETPPEPKTPGSKPDPKEETQAEEGSLPLQWLSSTAADVRLSADRVLLGEGWTGEGMDLKVQWADGRLQGPDLKLDWPDGGIRARGGLNATQSLPDLVLGLSAKAVDVESVERWLGLPPVLTGKAEWTLDLKTRGSSRKEFLAHLGGGSIVYIQHGTVLDRYANAMVLGFGSGSRSGTQPMNCLIAAVVAKKGMVSTDALFWEAPHKKLIGVGAVDLPQNHVDLLFRPHLRNTIPTGLTAAVRVEGPLNDPSIRPEALQTVADLTRGVLGRALRAVRAVSPQLSSVVEGVGTTTDWMVSATGLDVSTITGILAKPETCESILARPKVKELLAYTPDSVEAK